MVKFYSEKLGVKFPYFKYAQTTATAIQFNRTILAHQWIGDYVTTLVRAHIWLNKCFATLR